MSMADMQAFRFDQILDRKEQISKIIDLVYNQKELRSFFQSDDLEIDYNRISLAGQSFGAAAAAYTALHDERVTGALILLDPWLYPLEEQMKDMQLDMPTLVLRTESFDKLHTEIFRNKGMALELIKNNNKAFAKSSLSCFLKESAHATQSDLVLYIPREMKILKLLNKMGNVKDFVIQTHKITTYFLEVMLYSNLTPQNKADSAEVISKFNQFLMEKQMKSILEIDSLK